MGTRKVTGTISAWITPSCPVGPEIIGAEPERIIDVLSYSHANMGNYGWTLAGTAEITITLVDQDTLITNKVDALKSELSKHRADAQVRENYILEQISNLLAITHKPEDPLEWSKNAGVEEF